MRELMMKLNKTNMKKNKSGFKKNGIKILPVLAALILVVLAYYFVVQKHKSQTNNTNKTTNTPINYTPANKEEQAQANTNPDKYTSNPGIPNSSNNPTTSDVQIISASQNGAGNPLVIQTKLTGSGWQDCKLSITKTGSLSVIKNVKTLYQSDFSTCLGFSIEASEFEASGDWIVQITTTKVDGSTLISKEQTVSIVK